eukprot:17618-Heterococcus_DN1.PRE.2
MCTLLPLLQPRTLSLLATIPGRTTSGCERSVLDDSGGRGAGGAVTGLERTVIQLRNSAAVYI